VRIAQALHQALHVVEAATPKGNPAFAALIWWLVPLFAVTGAIIYVIWVSRFKDKYESETNRSVGAFQAFQRSFNENQPATPASGPEEDSPLKP
jgi:hypothetical protein